LKKTLSTPDQYVVYAERTELLIEGRYTRPEDPYLKNDLVDTFLPAAGIDKNSSNTPAGLGALKQNDGNGELFGGISLNQQGRHHVRSLQ